MSEIRTKWGRGMLLRERDILQTAKGVLPGGGGTTRRIDYKANHRKKEQF
jgi:hypothetical protein